MLGPPGLENSSADRLKNTSKPEGEVVISCLRGVVPTFLNAVHGTARSEDAASRPDFPPVTIHQKTGAAFQHKPPFIFGVVIVGRSNICPHRELSTGVFFFQMKNGFVTVSVDDPTFVKGHNHRRKS